MALLIAGDADCKNRETIGSYSYLKKCPSSKPLRARQVGCASCNDKRPLKLLDEKDNNLCPDREIIVDQYKSGYSMLKKCPAEAPLRTIYGCLPCDKDGLLEVYDAQECSACPTKRVQFGFNEGPYDLKKRIVCVDSVRCPNEKIMRTYQNKCIACSDGEGMRYISKEECELCAPLRYFDDESRVCLFRHSPFADKPLVQYTLMDTDPSEFANFYSCDDTSYFNMYSITEESCALCQNREYKEGFCVLKAANSSQTKTQDTQNHVQTNTKQKRKKNRPKGKWNSGGPLK